jgi:hypothetical protein
MEQALPRDVVCLDLEVERHFAQVQEEKFFDRPLTETKFP